MDRPEPGLVKWSPNPTFDGFVHINLTHRVVQVYEPTGHARPGRFDFKKGSKHEEAPPLTTYDWSPAFPGIFAVGTAAGTVNLLRLDDGSNGYYELKIKFGRPCHAVAFNTGNLLAVGLDRVRNDQCLHVWDVNRVSTLDRNVRGLPKDDPSLVQSYNRLEPSVSVSSVKFFEDSPKTLVAGLKNQGIRIYDLRDPHAGALHFPTKCNNNLAIDYADQNYFASSSLDQPGVVIWDRRANSRHVASAPYLEAVDSEVLPWGASLAVDSAINVQPERFKDRHSLIRSLRFCRERRGLLAVLSRTGQLKVLDMQKEFLGQDKTLESSPEILDVRKSYDLDTTFSLQDQETRNDRIVSFDWLTLGSPVLTPRALVLRASGAFDILEKPSFTAEHMYKMVPWQAPYRGLAEGSSYHGLMSFDEAQYREMIGPLLIDEALSDQPLFGNEKTSIRAAVQQGLHAQPPPFDPILDGEANDAELPELFTRGANTAEKLRGLRHFAKRVLHVEEESKQNERPLSSIEELDRSLMNLSTSDSRPPSNRQLHERLLCLTKDTRGFPKEAQAVLDHVMLLRSKEKYLFNPLANRHIVSDDPWMRDVWDWVMGAEEAAADEGMVSHGMDLSYMGVCTIWFNDLGRQGMARLVEGMEYPDAARWDRCLQSINKRANRPAYEGVPTRKIAHRQAGIDICNWGKSTPATDFIDYARTSPSERNSSHYTMATAHALFQGDVDEAVQTLKKGSSEYPELLFVSLALQLVRRGDVDLAKEQLDFDDAVASKTDPYLRAISTLIATNDWEAIANQDSLPLRERTLVALQHFDDDKLTLWLNEQVKVAVDTGDIEAIVLTGITDKLVDIFAKYVEKFNDMQSAILVLSICWPRFIDDYRCSVWRRAYRAYLQRHRAFYERTKFEVESTKRSKHGGRPMIKPPARQIMLRCVYCDAQYELSKLGAGPVAGGGHEQRNPLMSTHINAGVSCPTCGRHLPRCVVCLEVVGVPRSDKPEASPDPEVRQAARFPTFCLKCEHVLHMDHAQQWFSRHVECPVPECRCRCNFRANPELSYH